MLLGGLGSALDNPQLGDMIILIREEQQAIFSLYVIHKNRTILNESKHVKMKMNGI